MALVLMLVMIIIITFRNRVLAQNASKNPYVIQGGDIEQKTLNTSGESSIANSDKTTTEPFSFSVSDNLIDYGPLTPANSVLRTTDLTILKGSSQRYSVFSFEDRELSDSNNSFIPDTTCDSGTCSETSSAVWSGNLSFGLGFRCEKEDNSGCSEDFSKPDYFKQFANQSKSEAYQAIINSSDLKKAKIKYKVNISNNQAKSNYSNSITFIAIPNL